jgi:predicted  nucleic acid-binding Zn-ribbon protein
MSRSRRLGETLAVDVESVGGIDECSVELSRGVTALVGRNATNRTSLLRAVSGALGSDHATLKSDAESGRVGLTVGGETHTRTLVREDGAVRAGGDPLLDDTGAASLFAFLFESNPARTAVRRGDDLRDLIVRPVDRAAIEREVEERVAERDRIDAELAEADALAEDLPELERERATLREEVADLDEAVAAARDRLDAAGGVADGDEVESARADLRAARERLERLRDERETEREALDSLRAERADLRAELESTEPVSEARVETLDDRLDDLRTRKRSLESTLTGLQRVVQFNERVLDGDLDVADDLDAETGSSGSDPAAGLLPGGQAVTCWTCGTEVEEGRVRETVERLDALRSDLAAEQAEVNDRIERVAAERDDLVDRREARAETERRLDGVRREIERREAAVAERETRVERTAAAVERLEGRVERLRGGRRAERRDLGRELGDRRYERDRTRERLEEVETRIEAAERAVARREDLREERAAVVDRIESLRTRVERVEREAVESFNDHMARLLAALEYDNVDRVWLERTDDAFGLHVVRSTAGGAAYEDTVDHLSESERELIGLVFALAGYLVHDVGDRLPVMVVDSVEAIDGPRVARLLSYLGDRVPFVVAALLPEHATALPETVDRVTSI